MFPVTCKSDKNGFHALAATSNLELGTWNAVNRRYSLGAMATETMAGRSRRSFRV